MSPEQELKQLKSLVKNWIRSQYHYLDVAYKSGNSESLLEQSESDLYEAVTGERELKFAAIMCNQPTAIQRAAKYDSDQALTQNVTDVIKEAQRGQRAKKKDTLF